MEADTEKYLLGLDVSTFCIGFCIWNLSENKFETAGHIPLKKYKDWLDKVDHVCYILNELQKNTQTIGSPRSFLDVKMARIEHLGIDFS